MEGIGKGIGTGTGVELEKSPEYTNAEVLAKFMEKLVTDQKTWEAFEETVKYFRALREAREDGGVRSGAVVMTKDHDAFNHIATVFSGLTDLTEGDLLLGRIEDEYLGGEGEQSEKTPYKPTEASTGNSIPIGEGGQGPSPETSEAPDGWEGL